MTLRPAVRFLLYAVLVFAPLARGGVQDWAIGVIQMLVLAAAGVYLVDAAWRWEWRWNRTALDGPLLAMFGLALVSTLFSVYPPASWRAMGLLATYLLFYWVAVQVFSSRRRRREIVWVLLGLATILTGIGFFKLWAPDRVFWWIYEDIRSQGQRLTGPYGNPNHFANFLQMAVLLMLSWLGACRSQRERFILGCLISFCGIGLLMTLSRGAWLGFCGGVGWIMAVRWRRFRNWRRRFLLLAIGGGVCLFLVLSSGTATMRLNTLEQGKENISFSDRLDTWGGVFEMIWERPLTGFGPGTFSHVFPRYQPAGMGVRFFFAHNDPLEFTAEIGFLFPLLLCFGCFFFFRVAWKDGKSRIDTKCALGMGSGAVVVGMLLHCLVDFNLQIPANAFFFLLAMLLPTSCLKRDSFRQDRRESKLDGLTKIQIT